MGLQFAGDNTAVAHFIFFGITLQQQKGGERGASEVTNPDIKVRIASKKGKLSTKFNSSTKRRGGRQTLTS